MTNNCDCNNCTCDMDFSEDNGYKYVLDELKAIRAHVDKTINLLEKRMEKDKIINEVLSTEYDNEEDVEDDDIDFYEILEAYNKALDSIKQDDVKTYPTNWTYTIPLPRMWHMNKPLYLSSWY